MTDNLIEYGPDPSVTGKTLYAVIGDPTVNPPTKWNGSAFVAYVAANWATYVVQIPERPGEPGYFYAPVPSGLPVGLRAVSIRQATGTIASAANTDNGPGGGPVGFQAYWDGTTWRIGPAYADLLPSPVQPGYGASAPAGTTAVTDLAGGSSRNPSNMTVENSSSQPIQGATVTAYNATAYTSGAGTAAVLATAVTDSGGHWTLNIPAGEGAVTLVVAANGEVPQVLPSAFTV